LWHVARASRFLVYSPSVLVRSRKAGEYVSIFRKTESEFTIRLIIFSAVFLLQAFVSIPLLHGAFGFYDFGPGPFVLLPDLFTCLALAVLLYLTFRY
jgi:hypothetical protein